MKWKKLNIVCCLLPVLVAFIPALARCAGNTKINRGADSVQRAPMPDKTLLAKFELLCKKMNNVGDNYTLAGEININDKTDPAGKMNHVGFLFCKQGDEFYYRLGNTVTMNEGGVYLFIDNHTKRIMISGKKQVVYDGGLKQLANLGANIQSENYRMISKTTGDEQTISLINEHHISCKQYSLTFNKHSMQIKRLYMRLSNFNDPLRTDNEKIVDVAISRWDASADISKYPTKNSVIKNVNGDWKTAEGFKNYRLIKM